MERQNGTSSTAVLEPIELSSIQVQHDVKSSQRPSGSGRILRSIGNRETPDHDETLPSPITLSEPVENWKYPRSNIYKVAVTFWSFLILGLNDATYGPTIPYLQTYYNLEYAVVSLVFISPFVGYVSSAMLNNSIHMKFGRRGVAFIGPVCHLLAYIINCVHPPFPVLIVSFIIAGFGSGLQDAAWNAWIGAMGNANELLGLLHGFYGLGGVVAPLIATAMITKANLPWYSWYYCMLVLAAIELVVSLHAFRGDSGQKFRDAHPRVGGENGSRLKEAILRRPVARVTWLCALFLLGYVGAEVALGGWIVDFMLKVRHAESFASGMSATGFWLGLTVGRVTLGFVTPKIGEKLAIMIYLPIAMGLELLFWLVPQFYVSAVAVALQGFFLGPLFPAAIIACTRLLPKHLHVSSIGFAAAFGGSGGAIFPYAVGAIAQAKGVKVLQPILLVLLAVIWLLWLMLPRMDKKKD